MKTNTTGTDIVTVNTNIPKKNKVKKIILTIIAIIAISGVSYGGYCLYNINNTPKGTAYAINEFKTPEYMPVPTEKGSITVGFEKNGSVSLQKNEVALNYDLEVIEKFVKTGQEVKSGDKLLTVKIGSNSETYQSVKLELDTAIQELELAKLEAETKKYDAKQTLKKNENLKDSAYDTFLNEEDKIEKQLVSLNNQLESAKLNLYKKQSELEALKDSGTATPLEIRLKQEEVNTAQANYEAKEAEVNDYKANMDAKIYEKQVEYNKSLHSAENAQTIYDNELNTIELTVKKAENKVNELQNKLKMFDPKFDGGEITSPVDGIVTEIVKDNGKNVKADTTLVTISNTTPVEISVSVPQDDVIKVDLGMKANIEFSAYSGMNFEGIVDRIDTNTSGRNPYYTIYITCDTEDLKLYDGMTATVTFIEEKKDDILRIPTRAITKNFQTGKSTVQIEDENGNAVVKEVKTGISDGSYTEILEGLTENDKVLIKNPISINNENTSSKKTKNNVKKENTNGKVTPYVFTSNGSLK